MRCHPTSKRHGDETKKVVDGVASRQLAKLTSWEHRPAVGRPEGISDGSMAVEHMYASPLRAEGVDLGLEDVIERAWIPREVIPG
jgi:hypothetical protein